ncbi:MAG TPA: iron-containing redox enzyme family protein [Acidobacteriota bacterium]|nr:iron-containing redox enzyme family protein [Acidobacteriota bacterium]
MESKHNSHTLTNRLEENSVRRRFVGHDFFRRVAEAPLAVDKAAVIVGQWWHPLHYFPTFLARCIAVLPDIESKSAISRILAQEAGGGNVGRAHEVVYIHTMERAGFSRRQITGQAPFRETAALVEGYRRGSRDRCSALGSIFATEVTDLLMVSAIGKAVAGATGVTDLEWVEIHVEQEPDHVEEANHTMMHDFSAAEEGLVLESAEEMWRLWEGFFNRLGKEISASSHGRHKIPA